MKKGFIYILSNRALKDNLLKIGKTTKKSDDRSKQLSASTSIPDKFKVEDEFEFSDLNWAESEIHISLAKFRHNNKREFFNCELNVAKQVIIEKQILDKQREIDRLKRDLSGVKEILNGSEFIKFKWSKFFKNLNWDFNEVSESFENATVDFVLNTKTWDNFYDEKTKSEKFKILEKKTKVYILPKLPETSELINENQDVKEIVSKHKNNERLILISDKLIKRFYDVFFGWEYCSIHEYWLPVRFVESEKGIGLLDENSVWFCMCNGIFLKKEHLHPNCENIIDIWNEQKPAHNIKN